jgi:hypothetical protein
MNSPLRRSLPWQLFLIPFPILAGCGGGGANLQPPPLVPTFTSVPVTAAEEGMPYSYQLAATAPNGSTVTFSLTTAPGGATLSGSTINWTPTHAESRLADAFSVSAAASGGGSATQSWTVTPTGNVNITKVITFWTSSGPINVPPVWEGTPPAQPLVLVPQSDGSFETLNGSSNPDASFTIANVPAGFYWLEVGPAAYWTSASDFDDGTDVVGTPLSLGPNTNTLFDYSVSGIIPSSGAGDYFTVQSNVPDLPLPVPAGQIPPNTTTTNFDSSVSGDVDWSTLSTLYLSQFRNTSSGNFTGFLLGPSQTLTDVSISPGVTNTIDVSLFPAPPVSVPVDIAGTSWAPIAPLVGPGSPAPTYSAFSVFAQPYVTDRYAQPIMDSPFGPDLPLLSTGTPPPDPLPFGPSYGCGTLIAYPAQSTPNTGVAPIVADTNFGSLSYDDPYPTNWPRLFQYCQVSAIDLPRPDSTATDTFLVSTEETTSLPTGPVTPLLTPALSPTLNGSSLFQTATLNTTNLQFSWAPPSVGQPYAYFLEVYSLMTFSPPSVTVYIDARNYATSQTSLTIPVTLPDGTYVFAIVAAADASANLQTSPNRHQVPMAHSTLISAPFVIATSASSNAVGKP